MSNDLKVVKLKNGSSEVLPVVAMTTKTINHLIETGYLVPVYELIQLCKDPNHKLFGNSGDTLTRNNLIESDGSVHPSIKNIVLSSVTGEGVDISFVDPIERPISKASSTEVSDV